MIEKIDASTNSETNPAGLRKKNRMSWSDRAALPDSETAIRNRPVAAGVRRVKISTLMAT